MGKKNYVYVPKEHEDNIRLRGCKQGTTDMLTIETKERVRQKCE